MAQTSGFFEAEWDPELYNEETQEYGDWDRKYLAEQFARYFEHFISNGVMNDPVNQLKVSAGSGMTVVVSAGFAFINGYWFYNDSDLVLSVPLNETPSTRYDSVRVRWNATTRAVECMYIADDIINVRTDVYYDLQLAQIRVDASAGVITDAVITDTRANNELCGLINLVHAEDIGDISELETADKNDLVSAINSILVLIGDLSQLKSADKRNLVRAINTVQWLDIVSKPFEGLDSATLSVKSINSVPCLTAEHTNDEVVLGNQTFTFTNNQCTINDARITANTLADVYFNSASIAYATKARISVETYNGYLVLTAQKTPEGAISGMIKLRIV